MEFQAVVDFFKSLSFHKRKYPMILSYNKYLQKLDVISEQAENEVILFRRFLTQNPELKNRIFTNPEYKTGKKNLILSIDNFISGSDEQTNSFWDDLLYLERNLFLGDKPSEDDFNKIHKPSSINKVMASLENNPMFSDVVDQIRSSVDNVSDISNVGAIMQMPDFKNMVENIRGGLSSGKYKLKDLTNTVNTVIASVQDDFDPNTQNTLKTVTDTMEAVERGEPPDVGKLMSAMQTLKLEKTGEQAQAQAQAQAQDIGEKSNIDNQLNQLIGESGRTNDSAKLGAEQSSGVERSEDEQNVEWRIENQTEKLQHQIETELKKFQNLNINTQPQNAG